MQFNLDIVVEPFITREVCVNDSGVEEVDDHELEIDVFSSPLEFKGNIGSYSCIISSKKRKFCVWVGRQKAWDWDKNNRNDMN